MGRLSVVLAFHFDSGGAPASIPSIFSYRRHRPIHRETLLEVRQCVRRIALREQGIARAAVHVGGARVFFHGQLQDRYGIIHTTGP